MIVAMVTCSFYRDRSLFDEEDELLYGNDSMMISVVKKEEVKS